MADVGSSAGAQDVTRDNDLEGQLRAAEPEAHAGDRHGSTANADEKLQGGQEGKENTVPAVLAPDAAGQPKAVEVKALGWLQYALLVSISFLAPFSTDAYVPSMDRMREELRTTELLMGLTLQINMLVTGIASVFLGHLSDRIGRRPVMLVCLAFHILGSCLCAVAQSLEMLMVGRAIQGIGACAGVIPLAVVRDLVDDPQEFMRIASFLGAIRPAAIIAAPMVGGLLAAAGGWRSVFWLPTVWASLNLVATLLLLPETLAPAQAQPRNSSASPRGPQSQPSGSVEDQPQPSQPRAGASTCHDEGLGDVEAEVNAVAPSESSAASTTVESSDATGDGMSGWGAKLRRLFCDPLVTGCMLSFTMLYSGIVTMLSNFSFVLVGYFNLGETVSSVLIGSVPSVMFFPPVLVGLLSYRGVSPLVVLRVGMVFAMLVAAAGCAASLRAADQLWAFMAIMYGLVVVEAAVAPALNSLFLLPLKDMAGFAGSVQEALRSVCAAGIAAAATQLTELYQAAGLIASVAVLLASASIIFWASFGLRPSRDVLQGEEPKVIMARSVTHLTMQSGLTRSSTDLALHAFSQVGP